MTDESEWGPWIEHDGKGCPVRGQLVRCEVDDDIHRLSKESADARIIAPRIVEHIPRHGVRHASWHWTPGYVRVLRYRIRKPRAMKLIQSLLENLPERVDAE